MGVITFNGIASNKLGIQVEHPPGYETPKKDYEIVHVPGRNGDVYIDKGSYQNVSRTYDIAIGSADADFASIANTISEWLYAPVGYARLEDTYELDYYRLAAYSDATDIKNILTHAGRVTIAFDCKPQRFLKSGEKSVTFTAKGTLSNPTKFEALPTIIVKGSGKGVLQIGKYTVTISDINSLVTIDCELQDAYNGTANRNSTITLSDGFPKLVSGSNSITFSGGITSVEVIPKWWTL